MALDANINRIRFLRSEYSGRIPSPNLLEQGELAINLTDRTIYSKKGNGDVVDLGFGKGGDVVGAINQTAGGFTTTGTVKAPQFEGALIGNASTATKLQTARTITIQGDAEGSISFDGSVSPTMQLRSNNLSPLTTVMGAAATALDYKQGLSNAFVRNDAGDGGWPMAYAGLINFRPYVNAGGALQILTSYGAAYGRNRIKLRIGEMNNGQFGEWEDLITDKYIGTYAPTLTGVGATGNWNINVEGYATKLKKPVTINGTSFDGTDNIVVSDPTFSRFLATMKTSDANLAGSDGGVEFRFLYGLDPNKPIGVTDGPVMNMSYNNLWSFQILGDHRTGVIHTRPKNNGVWGSWKTTLNNENIGDHALPISGGTLNGNLIVNGNINSTGTIGSDSTKGFWAGNNRTIKPVDLSARTFAVNFVGLNGLNSPEPGTIYGDFMTFNTWNGSSGGKLNGLFLAKGSQRIKHYQAAYNATVWGDPLDIAYLTDNVASATKLETTRTIGISGSSGASGSVSFDGTSNALIPLSVVTQPTTANNTTIATTAFVQAVNSADTGSAATALTLKNARLIGVTGSGASGSVSFNGSSNVNIPLVVTTQPTATNNTTIATTAFVQAVNSADTGSAATALTLKTARTINGTSFNGSANITTANWGSTRNFTIGNTTRGVNGASNLSWTLNDIGALGVNDNAVSATKLQTPRKVNGVDFDGTQDITVYDSTKLPLSGGTITGNLRISNGLIVNKDVLVEGGIQGKTVRNRTGLDEKMYWIGAWNRPEQTNVVVTPVDANTLSFRITIQSGSQYIVNGSSQIHMLTGWGSGANAIFIDPVIMSTTDVNAGKQVIDVVASQPNHGITAPTNYFWYALTYESYGCKIDKWGGGVGDTRFLVRLKCDEKFVMKAPLISATSTSNNWFSGTQSLLDYPLQHSSYAVIVPTSVVEEQVVIWNVVENNTDAPASNCAYVSIVVKDRIA